MPLGDSHYTSTAEDSLVLPQIPAKLKGDLPHQGTPEQLASGQDYLARLGVLSEPLSADVRWSEEKCVHCTACVTTCPSGALALDRERMQVLFDSEKCIGCELCIPVCSYHAMEIHF